MKKSIIIIMTVILLISSVVVVNAEDIANTKGNVRLPAGFVTMNAKYGLNSWFDIKLYDVPDGFLVTNGDYIGWCAQKNILMTQKVNHTVLLFSSYDSDMPDSFKSDN